MKSSNFFLGTSLVLLILPGLLIKFNLYYKFQNKAWESHSARRTIPMENISLARIAGIPNFRYEYSDTSDVLHFNEEIAGSRLNIEKAGTELKISLVKPQKNAIPKYDPFKIKFDLIQTLVLNYKEYRIMGFEKPMEFQYLLQTSDQIVFKGKRLPKIIAEDSNIFIDSIGLNQSFDLDLDFSKCNWENFKKYNIPNKLIKTADMDRSITNTWKIDSLKMKLRTGTFFFNKDLKFNHISIDASHSADLHFESDDYTQADISVDTTVLLRAPYSIWKNLKIIEKK